MANERRLIDVNGSFTINASDNTNHSLCFGGGIISVIDNYGHIICEFFADDAPPVDAVEVVRCKDCTWFDFAAGCPLAASKMTHDGGKVKLPLPDDFCSYGEPRKEC